MNVVVLKVAMGAKQIVKIIDYGNKRCERGEKNATQYGGPWLP